MSIFSRFGCLFCVLRSARNGVGKFIWQGLVGENAAAGCEVVDVPDITLACSYVRHM